MENTFRSQLQYSGIYFMIKIFRFKKITFKIKTNPEKNCLLSKIVIRKILKFKFNFRKSLIFVAKKIIQKNLLLANNKNTLFTDKRL
jgi:hypothetical protein